MNSFKKILVCFVALILVLTVVSCGVKQKSEVKSNVKEAPTSQDIYSAKPTTEKKVEPKPNPKPDPATDLSFLWPDEKTISLEPNERKEIPFQIVNSGTQSYALYFDWTENIRYQDINETLIYAEIKPGQSKDLFLVVDAKYEGGNLVTIEKTEFAEPEFWEFGKYIPLPYKITLTNRIREETKPLSIIWKSEIEASNWFRFEFVDGVIIYVEEMDVEAAIKPPYIKLIFFDEKTGEELWSYDNSIEENITITDHRIIGDTVYLLHKLDNNLERLDQLESDTPYDFKIMTFDLIAGEEVDIEITDYSIFKVTDRIETVATDNHMKSTYDGYLIDENKWYDPDTLELLGENLSVNGERGCDILDIRDGNLFFLDRGTALDLIPVQYLACRKIK